MKHITFVFFIFMLVACGSAMSEEYATIPKGTSDNYSDDFLCTYCEENQSYYILTKSQWQLGNFIIPFSPRYHIYQVDNELSYICRVFSTPHIIYGFLSTNHYLFYEREAFLHSSLTELLYYDYQNKMHTRISIPGNYRLLAATDDELIYFSQTHENGVYSYTLSNHLSTLLFKVNKVVSCSNGLLVFQNNDGSYGSYALNSKQISILDSPSDKLITFAYNNVYIDEYNGFIWREGTVPLYKSMLNRYGTDSTISSIGVNDKYVCAYSPSWKNSSDMGIVTYFSMDDWENESSFKVSGVIKNINLINSCFLCFDYRKNSLIRYNLDNKEISTLMIP